MNGNVWRWVVVLLFGLALSIGASWLHMKYNWCNCPKTPHVDVVTGAAK